MFIKDVIEAMIKPSSGVSPDGGSTPSVPDNGKPFDSNTQTPSNSVKTINLVTGKDGKTLAGMTPADQAKITGALGGKPLSKMSPTGQDAMPDIMKMAKEKGFDIMMHDQQSNETRMPGSVIKHKQKFANMTDDEKKKAFAGKSIEVLKSMARRHGYGPNSDVYSKYHDGKTIDKQSEPDKITESINSDIERIKYLSGINIL